MAGWPDTGLFYYVRLRATKDSWREFNLVAINCDQLGGKRRPFSGPRFWLRWTGTEEIWWLSMREFATCLHVSSINWLAAASACMRLVCSRTRLGKFALVSQHSSGSTRAVDLRRTRVFPCASRAPIIAFPHFRPCCVIKLNE